MTMKPNDPAQQAQQGLTPDGLATQLFDAALMLNKMSDPREAAQHVIGFLTESLFYAIASSKNDVIVFLRDMLIHVVSVSSPDENARKEMLKKIGDTITNAPPLPTAIKPAASAVPAAAKP